MPAHLDLVASHGIPFRAVRLDANEDGNYPAATENQPLVEFYDRRYPHTPDGQFVSRYYESTLLERMDLGLNLDGGIPDWRIDSVAMIVVRAWLVMHRDIPAS